MKPDDKVIEIDFMEKAVRRAVFTNSKEEADKLVESGMYIYFPSELANFETGSPIYVLFDC